ncbi:MAG: GTP cyclohydrolase I FolE, partial [Nocardioides sp.]
MTQTSLSPTPSPATPTPSPPTPAPTRLDRWRPRISSPPAPEVDLGAAEQAAADLLAALGLPLDDDAMLETPRRMAHAYAEMLSVPEFDLTTFANDEDYDELV